MEGHVNTESENTTPGGSLCLSCGLCCQGLLHSKARLAEEETAAARRGGLRVVRHVDGGSVFALPCHHHDGHRCAIYEDRFSSCRSFQCKLLKEHLRGGISLPDAQRVVATAKSLVDRIQSRLGTGDASRRLWWQVRAALEDRAPPGQEAEWAGLARTLGSDLLLDLAALRALCNTRFLEGGER